MNVVHTEGREIGQIYIPFVNWALAAGTVAAVIGFGSSDALAGAYGIAVSLLMAITTLMATFVALHWKFNRIVVYTINASLFAIDLVFLASTSTKIFEGGWFPLLIALVISFLMLTWRKGEEVMDAARLEFRERAEKFVDLLRAYPPVRIPGTAIVLGRMAKGVPLALSHNVKCNRTLKENVLLVAVSTTEAPREPDENRIVVAPIAEGITRSELRFGFMEEPNVPQGLADAMASGKIPQFDLDKAIYYTGHETIIPSGRRLGLPRWREAIFAFMHHNAQRPGAYFKIPSKQIMEIGVEFEI
jgi:KUP system potassium uptake protein